MTGSVVLSILTSLLFYPLRARPVCDPTNHPKPRELLQIILLQKFLQT